MGTEALAPLRDVLEAAVASASPARVDVARLLAAAGVSPGDRWGKREASALAVGLDALGFGIEPDVRFDGPVLDAAKPAVVFRLPQGSGKAPTAPYRMGQLLLQLAVAVAAADGAADPRELDEALVHLDRLFALETPERVRLQAHLVWLEAAPPSLARLTSRLKTLASTARAALADAVVSIALGPRGRASVLQETPKLAVTRSSLRPARIGRPASCRRNCSARSQPCSADVTGSATTNSSPP